jgi:hypothetical protein
MALFPTAYETTIGSAVAMTAVDKAIQSGFVLNSVDDATLGIITSLGIFPYFLTGQHASDEKVPLFTHPRIVKGVKGEVYLCGDLRQVVKPGGANDRTALVIRNQTEYVFARTRLGLNLLWLVDPPLVLKNALPLAGTVFSAWLSGSLARRYALNPGDQLRLAVLSHIYYQNLFLPGECVDSAIWDAVVVQVVKATRAPPELVYSILESIESLGTISQLCTAAQKLTDNIRLRELNIGVLVTLLGTSWFGLNAKEIIAAALEHPPTWMALVYIVLFEKTFKNSMLARFAEQCGKSTGTALYIQSVRGLMDELQDPSVATESEPA